MTTPREHLVDSDSLLFYFRGVMKPVGTLYEVRLYLTSCLLVHEIASS